MSGAEFPLVEELRPMPDAETIFLQLAGLPHCVFLDSAQRHLELGRYSFLAADPFQVSLIPGRAPGGDLGAGATAFDVVAAELARWETSAEGAARTGDLPPFTGGAAGWFSYDLARQIERLPPPRSDEFQAPLLALGWYDVVIALDHAGHRGWILSQGLPELSPSPRRRRAEARLAECRRWLSQRPVFARRKHSPTADGLSAADLAPQFPLAGPAGAVGATSDFSAEAYRAAVGRAIEYVHAGDVFQVNLSQRLIAPQREPAPTTYLRLRQENPAPFAGYFDAGAFQLLSASPERFLRVHNGRVETRPIKGTRPRRAPPEADLFASDELLASDKDRAENVMIVDLLRNDLSRVCRPHSVQVTQLCALERYPFVQHLVSAVRGELAPGRSALDLMKAAFPGGSVTGAPKVRAMEIITELERTARGPYCGALGYVGFDGAMDANILIRTIVAGRGWLQARVGGGVVADSDPHQEYLETWHKAEGLLRALRPAG